MATFLLEVAKLADEMDHHPDISVEKAFDLTLQLQTHDSGNITEKDIELAKQISSLMN